MSFATGLKTIVVATDLQGQTEAALEYARKLAGGYGARIVLAHGVDPMDYAAVNEVPGAVKKDLTGEARAVLEKLAGDLLREGIHSHSEIREGAVAEMLAGVVKQYGADLLVMGTKGMQGAGPVVVGAIAERLVRMAPCPVLAVAADWNAGAFRPTPGGPVLLAVEENEARQAAVTAACSLARVFTRRLVIVHARTEGESVPDPCAQTLRDLGACGGAIDVRCMVEDGSAAEAVAAAIARTHPSILVAGVKRASDTPGAHGTAFALLARSRVPVLCVPPEAVAGRLEHEAPIPVGAA